MYYYYYICIFGSLGIPVSFLLLLLCSIICEFKKIHNINVAFCCFMLYIYILGEFKIILFDIFIFVRVFIYIYDNKYTLCTATFSFCVPAYCFTLISSLIEMSNDPKYKFTVNVFYNRQSVIF